MSHLVMITIKKRGEIYADNVWVWNETERRNTYCVKPKLHFTQIFLVDSSFHALQITWFFWHVFRLYMTRKLFARKLRKLLTWCWTLMGDTKLGKCYKWNVLNRRNYDIISTLLQTRILMSYNLIIVLE